jgi:hypothetical protein
MWFLRKFFILIYLKTMYFHLGHSAPERHKYEAVYAKFLQWYKVKKIKTYSKNCLLTYFQGFSSKQILVVKLLDVKIVFKYTQVC